MPDLRINRRLDVLHVICSQSVCITYAALYRKPNDGSLFTLTDVQVKLHPIIVSKLDKRSHVRDEHFGSRNPSLQ